MYQVTSRPVKYISKVVRTESIEWPRSLVFTHVLLFLPILLGIYKLQVYHQIVQEMRKKSSF